MTTPATPAPAPVPATPQAIAANRKRHMRNFLLDARFQLKFTSYIVAITMCSTIILGAFLWTTSKKLIDEAEVAVDSRRRAVEISKELSNATLSNKVAEHLNDPGFEAQLKEESDKIEASFKSEMEAIEQQRAELVRRQQVVWLTLIGCMAAFVLFIGFATIVTTHRIVGPVFRIKRLVNEVASGRLKVPEYPLRDGDELKDVFEALTRMVQGLRDRHTQDAQAVATVIERVSRSKAAMELLPDLEALQARIRSRID
jgi:methyl-accepting chemotaxis protein